MKVPPGYAVLDCGAAKSLCGAKLVAQMAQTCAREGKRVGDKRDTEAIDESYHFRGIGNQIVSSFMKLRVPGSIDGKEVSFSPSVTPGDIPPLVGNDHLIPWGCSIHLYPDECRLEIPSRGIDAKLHVTSSNHILVNLADFECMNEPDYDVWTSKRGRDSEETGTESDMTEGTEETITDPEEVPAKRSRRGAPRKPRVPRKKPPPAYIQLSPALQSELRKLQHAAARGSSASAAEWARVSRAADKALALLLPDKGPRSMEISTVYNCQDIGFECEPEKKQSDATQWIHAETVGVRLDSSCEDDTEGAEHRGCCIRNAHCDSESHRQEMGQVENNDRYLRQIGEFQTMSDELSDVKEQLCVASPTEGDDPDERSKHGVPRQQDLTQQQPPTESPPQKQHVSPQSSSQPLKQQSRKDPRPQQFHPEPRPQMKHDAPRQQPVHEHQESRPNQEPQQPPRQKQRVRIQEDSPTVDDGRGKRPRVVETGSQKMETDQVPESELPPVPEDDDLNATVIEVMTDVEVLLDGSSVIDVFAVNSARRKRVEVSERKLTESDRKLFRKAKELELQSWLDHRVFDLVKKKFVDQERVMRARWVLTWKSTGKAKARLCVLGFQDPDLTEVPRDSPTLSAASEALIMQWVASHKYRLISGDIKTAFLSGDEDIRNIFISPPDDVRQMLNLDHETVLRLRKAVYGLVNAPKKWWDRLKTSLIEHGFTSCALDPCAFVLRKSGKIHGVLGVHVDDVIGGGNETFDRIMTTVRKEFDFGAWDVGNFRFKGRQISQMPNGEIVCDMEQYKHELEQIDVSKADKTKPERVLNSKEHTQFRGGVGSLGWFVDHCCPQLSFQLAELRRKQASPTVQDLLKLNKVIRAAKVIESKIKIRSIPVEHLRFMGVHDAAHANLEGGASQQGHLILAVHASITNCRVPVSVLSWQSKKIKRVVRSSLAAETCSMSTCQEHLDWMRTMWEQMTRGEFVLENYEQFLTARPSILVTDCKSLYDAIHKEGAAPASTDKRLAIELAIVKAKAVSGETDLRWIDARYQIADCLTKHASRKSEAVLQKILQEAQWRITAEEDMLDKRKHEREIRNSSPYDEELWPTSE